jgi:glycosyltransferase involved in cell wall biosynthesis
VIFDARGASDHEAVLRLISQGRGDDEESLRRAFDLGYDSDRLAAQQSDAIVAVGELLCQKLMEAIDGEKQALVIPCCIERPLFSPSARKEFRDKLGVSDDELLFAHISTAARWEDFDTVISFFRAARLRRASRIIFLTTLNASVVTSSLASDDPIRQSIIVRKAQVDEVPCHLSAADVGLLLRKPHESFRVATPIKFSEYLGAGLATVVSDGIGNAAEIVESRRIGVSVPANADAREIEESATRLLALIDAEDERIRSRAIETCEELYLWERYAPLIAQVYGYHRGGLDKTENVRNHRHRNVER